VPEGALGVSFVLAFCLVHRRRSSGAVDGGYWWWMMIGDDKGRGPKDWREAVTDAESSLCCPCGCSLRLKKKWPKMIMNQAEKGSEWRNLNFERKWKRKNATVPRLLLPPLPPVQKHNLCSFRFLSVLRCSKATEG